MQHNRELTISSAGSRKATLWPAQKIWWSELVERLRSPVRGTETLADYLKMPKSQQDELKDVGGFVCGWFRDDRRKTTNVLGRDVITLDLDNIPSSGTQDLLRRLEGLGCSYAVYSTRKHHESKPRLRVLVPPNRTIGPDEYEPLARKVASIIGISFADPTTFESARLMYWPSCSADSQYVFQYGDKPFLDANGVLSMYGNWRNIQEWPEVPGASTIQARNVAKQSNPLDKKGVVGAFCRQYDVHAAIAKFLPTVYSPTDDGRYTFVGGSTAGGAVIYENGLFLYSHHATDPCSGKLVNAFDLVRLHKYGEQDDEAKPDTPVNKLPSYMQMVHFASELEDVKAELARLKVESLLDDFGPANEESSDLEWSKKLKIDPFTGKIAASTANVEIILENDPLLKGRIKKDTFYNNIKGAAPLPWALRENNAGVFTWEDDDDSGIRTFLEKRYEITSEKSILKGFVEIYNRHRFHPVKDYLNSLVWDGVQRAETMFIDWLGAEDIPNYTRLATCQFLKAMVKRIFEPGCEYQEMIVLIGEQGIYKSNIFKDLSKGWYLDSLDSTESKIVGERTEGTWIVTLDELKLFKKLSEEAKKEFISRQKEKYRGAYARRIEERLRQFVLVGTSNKTEILSDYTGNRRYIPILCGSKEYVMQMEPEKYFRQHVDQILAEAVMMYRADPFIGIPKEFYDVFDEQRKQFQYDNEYAEDVQKAIEVLGYPDRLSVEMVAEKLLYVGERPTREIKMKIKEAIKMMDGYKPVMKLLKVQGKPTRNGFVKVN